MIGIRANEDGGSPYWLLTGSRAADTWLKVLRSYFTLFAAGALACNSEPAAVGEVNPRSTASDASVRQDADKDGGLRDSGGGTERDATTANDPKAADATAGNPSSNALPCEIQTILAERCWTCHDQAVQGGAPMSLTNFAELHAQSPRAGQPYYQAVADRIQRSSGGMMPPAAQPRLSGQQKKALLDWVDAGAPAGEACEPALKDAGAPPPAAETDCDVSFELRAYEGANDDKRAFTVPQADDHYECFYFKADSDADVLATRLTPLLDKTNVLHHWLLFAADNENEAPSGTHAPCSGIHPGAALAAAWLPGTPELVMPDDVGMELPSGPHAQFILENHYNNIPRYQGLTDDSGVKVCATKKPKSQHAAIHWLGSERISIPPGSAGSASATCTPKKDGPIHILGVVPHMHKLGRHVKMTILRANGSTETLHEGPFEFEAQGYFEKNVVLQPGDRVTTKCDYENDTFATVTLGEKTGNEMCYMFTLAYPVGLMNTGGDYINPFTGQPFVQGPNRCMR